MLSITLIIIILTCAVSIPAFNSPKMIGDLIFYPPAITEQKQWYRFFSCGFIHADFMHLAFNMYALYSFGGIVENGYPYRTGLDNGFVQLFGRTGGKALYGVMYLLALGVCLLPTYFKHKNDYGYRSLGASGAVSAVLFAGMLLEPRSGVGLIFVPGINIPGYVFAPLYLIISHYLAKKGTGNINHSAHLWGAIFGLVFIFVTSFAIAHINLLANFVDSIKMDFRR